MTSALPVQSVRTAEIKLGNRSQVLSAFFQLGSCTALDVANEIGLSRQTVMKAIRFFVDNGILEEQGKGESTASGGKRPERYGFSSHRFFLCISLWPKETRLHLYAIGGQEIDSLLLEAPLPDTAKQAVDNAGKLSAQLLAKNQIELSQVVGVSLSTAGTVNAVTGVLLYNSQCPSWGSNVPILQYLQPYFHANTLFVIDNAGKMTGRATLHQYPAMQKRAIVFFTGWGLSACLIERGHILSGKSNLIGELGHMIIYSADREVCNCGGRGCAERMCSVERVRALVDEFGPDFPPSPLKAVQAELTIPQLFDYSRSGDLLAQHIVKGMAWVFASTIRNTSLAFDPDIIIFQGDYACADQVFKDRLTEEFTKFRYLADHPFEIYYDRQPLRELDAQGSYLAIARRYFRLPEVVGAE